MVGSIVRSWIRGGRRRLGGSPLRAIVELVRAARRPPTPTPTPTPTEGTLEPIAASRFIEGEPADVVDPKRSEAELRQAIEARDELLSIAGHELRTPLAALTLQVTGLARMLGDDHPSPEARLRERLRVGRITKQVERLTRLTEDLLDVARISSGQWQLRLDACDLSELAREVVAGLQDQAARAGCVLRLEATSEVLGVWDRFRIEQVITNLVVNAFKYGAGEPVDVVVRAHGTTAELEVRDRGIGIASHEVARIFGRFERAADSHERKSLGMGLYIARQVVEAHGGEIRVESVPGLGSRFLAVLPRRRAGLGERGAPRIAG